MTPPAHPSELLVRRLGWIQALARELVGDAALADDLVQDACVAALEHPPRDAGKLSGWLATVLKNLSRQRMRGEGRRRSREVDSARPEAIESTASVVERASTHRRLVETVLALEEPYRTAILSRYFDELPPREIARRTGVPVATVHSQLKRALAQLRGRLDDEHDGDRRSWMLLLLPVAERPGPATPWILGGALVNAKIVAGAAVLALAGTATIVLLRTDEPPAPEIARPAEETAEPPAMRGVGVEDPAPPPSAGPGRSEVPVAPVAEEQLAAPVETASGTWLLRGRVVDVAAQPLGGVELEVEGHEGLVVSDAGGRFEAEVARDDGGVVPAWARWVAVHEGSYRRDSGIEPVVVLAPGVDCAGRVVDEYGGPVAHANVELVLPPDLDVAVSQVLDATRQPGWVARADGRGRFELGALPAVAGAVLHTTAEGFERDVQPMPLVHRLDLTVVLSQPAVPLEGVVTGRVVDPGGFPVEGARVALGVTSATTDDTGQFRVSLSRALTAERMTAVKEGFLPAFVERPMDPAEGLGGWPEHVELRLGGEPLSIAGRVVDSSGDPVEGVKVWLADSTPFGAIGVMPAALESLAAGAEIPARAFSIEPLPADNPAARHGYQTNAGPPTAFWNWATTDASGRFELGGLLDRDYTLRAMHTETLALADSETVRAGERDVRIRLDETDVHERLLGRVVTADGTPVPNVRVTVQREPYYVSARIFGGTAEVSMTEDRESIVTDDEGRFALEDLPRAGMRLRLTSNGIVPLDHDLPDEPAGTWAERAHEIVVEARCHVQLDLDPAEGIDLVRAVDGEGDLVLLSLIREGSVTNKSEYEVLDGRTSVLSVSSRARALELIRDNETVRTVPIRLVPGEVTVVRE